MSIEPSQNEGKLLLVDDQDTARFLASEILLSAGFSVIEAKDGPTALSLIQSEAPDVILLDLIMPGMDGYAVCQSIRANEQNRRIPILMVTGVDDEETIERCYDAGASDFISKPFKRYVLIQRVLALVRTRKIEDSLHKLAYFDSLTTLANRASFGQQLSRSLSTAKRYNRILSVLYLDLDDFKRINDTLGHSIGDSLLKIVATRLQESIRDTDHVEHSSSALPRDFAARLGGDEFIILLPEIQNRDDAEFVARRIQDAVSRPVNLSNNEIFITCSIGIALYPDDSENIDALLTHADNAMYAAKNIGKNNFCFYDASMDSATLQRLAIDSQLRHALEKDEFALNYQPQIDACSGKICGIEALLRWNSEELGSVSPAEFIPVAEENGLIVEIGKWVLYTACRQMEKWMQEGLAAGRISVNISVPQFSAPEFANQIDSILKETNLSPNLLELEITESLLAQDVELAVKTLFELKKIGVMLAVDDFGTGYSSLNQLKKFPIDRLKIDRSFVNDINQNSEDAAIATAIISMAKSMNLEVIAEGVETKAQLDVLLGCGCREIQGYYYSRPLTAESMSKFLSEFQLQPWKSSQPDAPLPRVLFLDADVNQFADAESNLRSNSVELFVASDSSSAFDILENQDIDVLVADHEILDMAGNQVLVKAKILYPGVVRMMLSSQIEEHSLIQGVNEARIYHFLKKPIDWAQLQLALDDALNLQNGDSYQKAA